MADNQNESTEVSRDEALKFLETTTQFLGSYHNHKETSAWGSVGLFVLASGQLLQYRGQQVGVSSEAKTVVISLLALLCVITIAFMRKQFGLRREAAQRVAACLQLRCEIISNPKTPIETRLFTLRLDRHWPEAIVEREAILRGNVGTQVIGSLESAAYLLSVLVGLGTALRLMN